MISGNSTGGFNENQQALNLTRALKASGVEEMAMMLRCKVRYFTDGTVLGAAEFVDQIWEKYRKQYNPKRRSGARRMRGKVWGGLCTMRDLRKNVIQLPAYQSPRGVTSR